MTKVNDLKGRVCLVTGAASGLGLATARLFAAAGGRLIMADWNRTLGEIEAAKLTAAGYDAMFVHTDVSSEASVEQLVDRALVRHGRIDVLSNTAGVGFSAHGRYWMGPLVDSSLADWDAILRINLTSVFLTVRRVAPGMLERRQGSIINVSSTSGLFAAGCDADAYSASKAGMIALSRSLAVQFGPSGVRVNCIAPGGMETPMVAEVVTKMTPEQRAGASLLGRMGKPEEVAELALFLASDRGSFMTGQTYLADGGFTAI